MDIETEAVLIRQAKMANARLHNLQQILRTNDGVRKDAMLEALDATDPMNREIRKPQGLRRHTQACLSTFLSNSSASVQPLQSPEPRKHRPSTTKKCQKLMRGSKNYRLREHSHLTASRIFNDSVPQTNENLEQQNDPHDQHLQSQIPAAVSVSCCRLRLDLFMKVHLTIGLKMEYRCLKP